MDQSFQCGLQAASSNFSVTDDGLDGGVVATETEKFRGWGRGEEPTDKVGGGPGRKDPCPAEIHGDIREMFRGGYDVLLVGPAHVHEHESILWPRLC